MAAGSGEGPQEMMEGEDPLRRSNQLAAPAALLGGTAAGDGAFGPLSIELWGWDMCCLRHGAVPSPSPGCSTPERWRKKSICGRDAKN